MSLEVTTLPSGLRIATERMVNLETASLGVYVGAGSRHERSEEHGLSHLLEHMAFKGTRRRSARAIAEEIETAGGELNAATSIEHTAYYAHVLGADITIALDILADILTESTFDSAELEREKSVILQEIGAVEDTPDDLVFEILNAAAFPDQPIGRPILGTREHVAAFSREAIGRYLDIHYRPEGMVIGAAGAIDHDRICEEVVRRFNLPVEGKTPPVRAAPARYQGGERRLRRRLEQVHLTIGFEGVSYAHEDFYALQIFASACGGGMSSRLFQEVREARGLAYAVHAFHWGFSDAGLFGFYAAASTADVTELLPVALDCLAKATQDLSEAEVRRAKAQMKVSLLAALESPGARSEQIARQLMAFNRILTREEIIQAIDRLDVSEIRKAGARALGSKPTLAMIGPPAKVLTCGRITEQLAGI
ncbi:MAG TPA: pitrilysin family protein [Methylocella sp.]|nr:pitrilysin family protein [Methylocella sp.]